MWMDEKKPRNYRHQMKWINTCLHDHMQKFGYVATELPIIFDADVFLIKAGDRIINHLFTFDRNGRQLALRPEFTAAAIYRYIENDQYRVVSRWQFSGDILVDDPIESKSDYQHLAIGAEIIGMREAMADTEIIAMSALGLSALEIDNWEITVGHAGMTQQILATFNLDSYTQRVLLHQIPALNNPALGKDFVIEYIENRLLNSRLYQAGQQSEWPIRLAQLEPVSNPANHETTSSRTPFDITRRLREKHKRLTDRPLILKAVDFLDNWCKVMGSFDEVFKELIRTLPETAHSVADFIERWKSELQTLTDYGIPTSRLYIKPDLARNWEYYTGTVFDLHVMGVHVGGGGRYDEFARLIGSKEDVPAVGFTYYGDELLAALSTSDPQIRTYCIYTSNDDLYPSAIKLAQKLRDAGLIVQILPHLPHVYKPGDILIDNIDCVRIGESTFSLMQLDQIVDNLKS